MNREDKLMLAETLGGSHAYGLNTPNSDTDLRGIFVNTDVSHLVGLKRDEVLVSQKEGGDDKVYTEFRHALKLLRGANTQMIELLFTDSWIVCHPLWQKVQEVRSKLICSHKLFACLKGYMQGELRLANGERTGRLGGKRKEAIDKYGFSPKNFVQLLRLARAGCVYFEYGIFPVNIMKYNPGFGQYLLDIKTNPQNYTKEELNAASKEFEIQLVDSFNHRKFDTVFDEDTANNLCLQVYGPLINELCLNK